VASKVRRTLPLSGRHEAWGGIAEIGWGPVHSRGLFEVPFAATVVCIENEIGDFALVAGNSHLCPLQPQQGNRT